MFFLCLCFAEEFSHGPRFPESASFLCCSVNCLATHCASCNAAFEGDVRQMWCPIQASFKPHIPHSAMGDFGFVRGWYSVPENVTFAVDGSPICLRLTTFFLKQEIHGNARKCTEIDGSSRKITDTVWSGRNLTNGAAHEKRQWWQRRLFRSAPEPPRPGVSCYNTICPACCSSPLASFPARAGAPSQGIFQGWTPGGGRVGPHPPPVVPPRAL